MVQKLAQMLGFKPRMADLDDLNATLEIVALVD